MPEPIYRHPDAYDLEHEGDTEDIDFFVRLAVDLRPKRVLELACGTGRVTIPLAEAGARNGFEVVGLELVPHMLESARERLGESAPEIRERLELLEGDMRTWEAPLPFDLIVSPCSSMCHLLTLEDQLAAWRQAFRNLSPGGRLVVDVSMPDLAAYGDSFLTPPREVMQVDRDTRDPDSGERLIRYRTTRYLAHEQRARIRYLYDRLQEDKVQERFASDYESHVYYPRELTLLFLHSGFEVKAMYGDYHGRPLGERSRSLIVVGRKPE
jgi:SAM-dependent methyltransferase